MHLAAKPTSIWGRLSIRPTSFSPTPTAPMLPLLPLKRNAARQSYVVGQRPTNHIQAGRSTTLTVPPLLYAARRHYFTCRVRPQGRNLCSSDGSKQCRLGPDNLCLIKYGTAATPAL